jgi:CYTH domain-containing protein/thymidylate kinase
VIAVEGGPCAGKTTFLAQTRQWLEKSGIHQINLTETATELINAGASPAVLGTIAFQERLMQYSLDRENNYLEIAKHIGKKTVIFCDRGVLDCAAYMGTSPYRAMLERLEYSQSELMHRYQLVLHLVTTADGAEEFYTCENNTARRESPEEARELDVKTQEAWYGHPHQVIIDNSTNFAGKMLRARRSLARILHMPEPTEIERKFLFKNFTPELIPESAVAVEIVQEYLVSRDSTERRIRKRTLSAREHSYFYTEKKPTGKSGTRIEKESEISELAYLNLRRNIDPTLKPVNKTRHHFRFGGKMFELDVFGGRHSGLVVLEVELQNRDEPIEFPMDWDLVEVTDDPHYKNRALAEA